MDTGLQCCEGNCCTKQDDQYCIETSINEKEGTNNLGRDISVCLHFHWTDDLWYRCHLFLDILISFECFAEHKHRFAEVFFVEDIRHAHLMTTVFGIGVETGTGCKHDR